jgi:hypothetical protein
MTKIAGSGSESGTISQRHGSADPDPIRIHTKMSWIRNTALGDIYLKDSITRPQVKLERGQIGNFWWIFYRI